MALRTPLSVTPHLYMGDSTGRPLDMGTVYFGEPDKDPEFYPINLFSDDALTLPLMQPVHTKGGYLYDKGDMVEPHAKELIYSVKVLDSYGRKVFYKGAMMRNSWNDDVIEQINAAIVASTDIARQVATDITNEAINNTAVEGGVLADTFVTMTKKHTDAVARNLRDINSETLSVLDFGVKVGIENAVANCDAYAKLAAYVNSRGGSVVINWPESVEPYYFAPKDHPSYGVAEGVSWRTVVELVDVNDTYHVGHGGARAYIVSNPADYCGNPTVRHTDESVIQFRSTAEGKVKRVGVSGLNVDTDRTLPIYGLGKSDGTTMGISYRGCENTITMNTNCDNFGTDGIYFGMGYGNTHGGKNHILQNASCDGSFRQGISVVNNSHGHIIGGILQNSGGNNFGYGIDFEPNPPFTQTDWLVEGLRTKNNQFGACNHIQSSGITYRKCYFDEQSTATTNSGCTKFDGSSATNNIKFIDCDIISKQAVVYALGDYLDNILFDGCRLSTTGAVANSAQIRINPVGTSLNVGTFIFKDCIIRGNGGYYSQGATVIFDNTKWYPSKDENTKPLLFGISATGYGGFNFINGSELIFADDWDLTGVITPQISSGLINKVKTESTSSFKVEWKDYGAGRNVVFGDVTWGANSFYKGVHADLDVKSKKVLIQTPDNTVGEGRVVHGGISRVLRYGTNKASFAGQQLPMQGDILNVIDGSYKGRTYVYDATDDKWKLKNHIVQSGATTSRPHTAYPEGGNVGLSYFDTTLNKMIWWSGSAWVDATGTSD